MLEIRQTGADARDVAVRKIPQHLGVAGAPARTMLGVQPDEPAGARADQLEQVDARIAEVAARVAENEDRGPPVELAEPAAREVGERAAVVRRAEAGLAQHARDRLFDRLRLEDVADLEEPPGERERADPVER